MGVAKTSQNVSERSPRQERREKEIQQAEYICVHCGTAVRSLYREYSKGNIRLSRCGRCGNFADEYVEMESKLVVIDLILHKTSAFRHVLVNESLGRANKQVGKFLILIFAFDSFDRWFYIRAKTKYPHVKSAEFPWEEFARWLQPHDFQWLIPLVAISETLVFILTLCLATHVWMAVSRQKRKLDWRLLANSIIVSSFSKVGVVLWMVWDASPLHRRTISLFTLTSNVLTIRVLLRDERWIASLLIVLVAFFARTLFSWTVVTHQPSLLFKII